MQYIRLFVEIVIFTVIYGKGHANLFMLYIFLAPVVQRPNNFIQWISHYPTVSICAKISVFHRVQANMHTLSTV